MSALQPVETAPLNERVLVRGIHSETHSGHSECAMAWRDRINNKWYYAPNGGLIVWTVTDWMPLPEGLGS